MKRKIQPSTAFTQNNSSDAKLLEESACQNFMVSGETLNVDGSYIDLWQPPITHLFAVPIDKTGVSFSESRSI